MKRVTLKWVVIIPSLALAAFGASGRSAAQTESKPAPEAKMHNMSGCLTKEGDSYIVMNADPKGPKRIAIIESPRVDLAADVGNKIQITGVEVPMKQAKAMSRKAVYWILGAIRLKDWYFREPVRMHDVCEKQKSESNAV